MNKTCNNCWGAGCRFCGYWKWTFLLLVFLGACGPAFSNDLFGGERDATTTVVSTDVEAPTIEASANRTDAGHPEGSTSVVGDASGDSSDAAIEACSCAELCSGAYSLRACESCYQETCPSWEGGLPRSEERR